MNPHGDMSGWIWVCLLVAICGAGRCDGSKIGILVAGSANADTFLTVDRLPKEGENLTLLKGCFPVVDVAGGKGCNQAIACARLGNYQQNDQQNDQQNEQVYFLGQFGNDQAGEMLQATLRENGVELSLSERSQDVGSGRGYVFLQQSSGKVSAVVSGGSNLYAWGLRWNQYNHHENHGHDNNHANGHANDRDYSPDNNIDRVSDKDIEQMLDGKSCLLLQREIPELINLRLARVAHRRGLPVLQDVGGEDRPITSQMMSYCDYLMPNETELERLASCIDLHSQHAHLNLDSNEDSHEDSNAHSNADLNANPTVKDLSNLYNLTQQQWHQIQTQIGPSINLTTLLHNVHKLQQHGANHVLVTLGSSGSILLPKPHSSTKATTTIIYQPPCPLPPGTSPIDETGAGDCYRAGFAVSLLSSPPTTSHWKQCMKFASAAGALAVTKPGAVPSIPSRAEVLQLLQRMDDNHNEPKPQNTDETLLPSTIPRGGTTQIPENHNTHKNDNKDNFPFLFGSRINSMKDRPELHSLSLTTPQDYLRRQSTISGLGCVDFNYPQHFYKYDNNNSNKSNRNYYWTPQEAKRELDKYRLKAGAVCLRYPPQFARGAMNHPDPNLRQDAIELTKEAAHVATQLGCDEVVIWSAYDGYDYPFQVHYDQKWTQLIQAFQECCDAYPHIKFSLEYKPTDEHTRFFTVPSTAAAILLVQQIQRDNMGLTLDMGHMLMSGENPAQSIAMVGNLLPGKLFGIQLNDGYTRLAAEDGMMFGSIHPSMALEVMYQLKKIGFEGHFYFDTFPQRTDPIKEAEYNIQKVKEFWTAVECMDEKEVETVMNDHDALGALELVNKALRRQ